MGGHATANRSLIEQSWHRSRLGGVDPGASIAALPRVEVDRESRLIRAASPILDELATELAGERFGLLLTDDRTRIVARRVGTPSVGRQLDAISAAVGTRYAEDVVGTNALGTANEAGAALSVVGDEHFNETLKLFCCFGAPIRNIVTGRIQGVLDICGHVADRHHLFPPYIMGAVRQIEQRLAEDTGASSMQLLAEYRAASTRTREPVIALNDEVTLTSRAAQDMLAPADYAVLEDMRLRMTESETRFTMTLTRGAEVRVHARLFPGGGGLFRIEPGDDSRWTPITSSRLPVGTVLVSGELGSGRTARAERILGPGPIRTLDAGDVLVGPPPEWLRRFRAALEDPSAGVLVENVHLLPEVIALRVVEWLKDTPVRRLVMTSRSDAELSPAQALITSLCDEQVVTAPLRHRRADIPQLVGEILADEGCGNLRITPTAMSMLVGQDWSGNVVELAQVLRKAAAGRNLGDITPADLPTRYRVVRAGLSRMEQVERDAIVDALLRTDGHRARAAEYLGISRRTIFNRMRALRITEHDTAR
ncbi:MAG TPA: helix-turn-helix domain-containing protein [Pseudonocardia sp.]|jgi:transcriptional regulator of acetoin/glycerol metabolism|nr:helix-turn-helix domain-containing protein [Pseudonocardia sp.]